MLLLLLVPAILAAPTTNECFDKCSEEAGPLVNNAFELKNFRQIAVDVEGFCSSLEQFRTCIQKCPSEQTTDAEMIIQEASFVCDKQEEFKLTADCVKENIADEMMDDCISTCELSSETFRFDSSPKAAVNPAVDFEHMDDVCNKHVCALKCTVEKYNTACVGSGSILMEMAKEEIVKGHQRLMTDSMQENDTKSQLASAYLNGLPEHCAVMKDASVLGEASETSQTPGPMGSMVPEADIIPVVMPEDMGEASGMESSGEEETTEAQPETEEGSSEETTTQVLFIDDTTEEDSVNTNNIEEPQEVKAENSASFTCAIASLAVVGLLMH